MIFFGICFGIITGLTPGIHINLISSALIALSPALLIHVSPIMLAVFIISMSVTHTFLDAIPSIFLGAPDSAQALGVLPGHRFLLKGKGFFALKLTLMGSFGATLISILLFPLFVLIVKFTYSIIEMFIPYLIIAVVLFMILRDRKKLWAFFVFCVSGILGLIVLNLPSLNNPLFPLLSGLFGVSTLLYSLKDKNKLPKQKTKLKDKIPKPLLIKALFSGCFSGFITAVMPGLGAGMAAVISSQITRKLGDVGFMMLIGSISTFNFILSLVTFYTIEKARNGSIIAVQKLLEQLTLSNLIIILASVIVVGSLGVFLALNLGKGFIFIVNKINYKKLVLGIIAFIFFLGFVLSGPIGILILLTSTAVGLIPAIVKTTRTMGMGCLIVPVLMYFLF